MVGLSITVFFSNFLKNRFISDVSTKGYDCGEEEEREEGCFVE
jgi:hypothetical protein